MLRKVQEVSDDTSAGNRLGEEGPGGETTHDTSARFPQVAVVHGDPYLYHLTTDTPEEKYRVGLNYLHGGAQRSAEKLIREAFTDGLQTTVVAFHWVLAILSGRSFHDLRPDDIHGLMMAFQYAGRHASDQWSEATKVVEQLVDSLVERGNAGEPDPIKLDAALSAFERLPGTQLPEIRRHLGMILVGRTQEFIETKDSVQASENRRARAWKYFEPEPTEPRLRLPKQMMISAAMKVGILAGTLISCAGLLVLVPLLAGASVSQIATAALLSGAGGLTALSQRWKWLRFEQERDGERRERTDLVAGEAGLSERQQDFAVQVKKAIDEEFGYLARSNMRLGGSWNRSTRAIRSALHRELVDLYGDDGKVRDVRWLIRYYARSTFTAWRDDSLGDGNEEPSLPRHALLLVRTGTCVAVAGAAVALFVALQADWRLALLATLVLTVGGYALFPAATAAYLERHRYLSQLDAATRRYGEQFAAYGKLVNVLADRPTDFEIARWLDYDKAYVRGLALRQYGLDDRKVITHAVVSQMGRRCRLSRVPYGPPRYSSYLLDVFLLSGDGIRQARYEVNFLTGEIAGERRLTFRYDAITAVRVDSVNIESDGDQSPVVQDGTARRPLRESLARSDNRASLPAPVLLSRTVRVSLVNGTTIAVQAATFDDGGEGQIPDDLWKSLDLAFDISGLDNLRHIIEAVATEGEEWLSRERGRRGRRFKTYQNAMG